MTGNWLDSPQGKRVRKWQRELAEVLAHANLEPRSKKSLREAEAQLFQKALADALGKRRGFRAPIALELDFRATADNPPEIHTVAKNYIDLAYRAPVGGGRLMKDDRQIRYLAVSYTLKMTAWPSIFVRAARMSGFHEDVRLAREIHADRDVDARREDSLDESLDALQRWEAERESLVSNYGQATFAAHHRLHVIRIQQAWLSGTERLLHSLLLDALSQPNMPPSPAMVLGGRHWPALDINDLYKRFLFSPTISLSLAPLPQKEGQGEEFKKAVKDALTKIRAAHPRLFPLYSELAVTILLVPPARAATHHNATADLDNLARKVMPHIHGILEPPTTQDFSYLENVRDSQLRAYFEQRAKIARRLPRYHVTRYEVVQLPRTTNDPPEGSVRLVLCDGAVGSTFGQFVRNTIEKSNPR